MIANGVLPRWLLIVAGLLFGATAGNAINRHGDGPADARTSAAQVRAARAANRAEAKLEHADALRRSRASAARKRAADTPSIDHAAAAAAADLDRAGIDAAVAVGTLGSARVVTQGVLGDAPQGGLAGRLLTTIGALRTNPAYAAKNASAVKRALSGEGSGDATLMTDFTRADTKTPPSTAATHLLEQLRTDGQPVDEQTPSAGDVVRALRAVANGCAFSSPGAAITFLNDLRDAGHASGPGKVFPGNVVFANGSIENESNTYSIALIDRGDDALVVVIATAQRVDPVTLDGAWRAFRSKSPVPAKTTKPLPRTCTNPIR